MKIMLLNVDEKVTYTASEVLATNRRLHNPWRSDFVTSKSETSRNGNFRTSLRDHYHAQCADKLVARCQFTGIEGVGCADVAEQLGMNQVKAAHLIPRATKKDTLARLDLNVTDVNSVRNGLLLLSTIEEAFDDLRLSFIPNPLGQFALKIWDPAIRTTLSKLGKQEGDVLNVASQDGQGPFKRVLSYHAYLAYHNAIAEEWIQKNTPPPQEFGSSTGSLVQLERLRIAATETDSDVRDPSVRLSFVQEERKKQRGGGAGTRVFSPNDVRYQKNSNATTAVTSNRQSNSNTTTTIATTTTSATTVASGHAASGSRVFSPDDVRYQKNSTTTTTSATTGIFT